MRATKSITVTLPLAMARETRRLAKRQNRSVSALVRDALHRYQQSRPPYDDADRQMVDRILAEVKSDPWTPERLEAEEKRLNRWAERHAKKIGFKEEDVVPIIHEFRARRRATP